MPNMMKLAIATVRLRSAAWTDRSVLRARSGEAWMPERIFVVGHAAVTCLGRDMDSTWQGLIEGRSGIRRHAELGSESFLQDLGGMVEELGPETETEDPAIAKLSARFLHLSMAAAREAFCRCGAGSAGRVDRPASGGGGDRLGVSAGSTCSRPSRSG